MMRHSGGHATAGGIAATPSANFGVVAVLFYVLIGWAVYRTAKMIHRAFKNNDDFILWTVLLAFAVLMISITAII
jgi:hypothetical protein